MNLDKVAIRRMHPLFGETVLMVGYDPAAGSRPNLGCLIVKFRHGSISAYADVPYAVVLALLNAVDVDASFNIWVCDRGHEVRDVTLAELQAMERAYD
jgi:hypothetical protein